jgi:hypothetical protein
MGRVEGYVEFVGSVSRLSGYEAKITDRSITLDMIPKEMLHQKPIDLRHICLFYLGHM